VASALRSGAGNCSGVGSGREDCVKVLSRLPRERHGFDHRIVANDNGAARGARDVAPGERWTFLEHRSMAETAMRRAAARGTLKAENDQKPS
jgi:hypothetical protein